MVVSSGITFSFLCGIRGYHEYKLRWTPVANEELAVRHEASNRHDCYALAVMKRLRGTLADSVVGHLPREISRFLYFIIVHGASVSCKVTDARQRRSPLVQGGLEIPCEVTIKMELHDRNLPAIDELKRLIDDNYKEPIDGNFPDATKQILEQLQSPSDSDDTDGTDEEPI